VGENRKTKAEQREEAWASRRVANFLAGEAYMLAVNQASTVCNERLESIKNQTEASDPL